MNVIRASLLCVTMLAYAHAGAPVVAPADEPDPQACIPREKCCKVCRKGKACGNTCISRAYECHVGRGCACDADEICE
jgi:hypothetical protein